MTDENAAHQPPIGNQQSGIGNQQPPRWQPIGPADRRVAGVLAEKAKTTPAAYPMSLNAIETACNQKSNRWPVMHLEPDEIEESLDRLRELGAVGLIEGHGRVVKYRHYLYQWLGVDKVELAVMAELLLRGAQTEGELRGRAARMEPIADLAALRPVLGALKSKGLVVPLTPEGRGHVVTHALYPAGEMETVRAQYGPAPPGGGAATEAIAGREPAAEAPASPGPAAGAPPARAETAIVEALRRDIEELRIQLTELRGDLAELSDRQERTEEDLRQVRDALGP